jgi:hypothetical protein
MIADVSALFTSLYQTKSKVIQICLLQQQSNAWTIYTKQA